MSLVRVYLPLTADDLRALDEQQQLEGELEGYGVTAVLRRSMPDEDLESLEFIAQQDAAAAMPPGHRIVVAAADVEATAVAESLPGSGGRPTALTVTGPLGQRRVASLHLGDPGEVATDDRDVELSWYDVTELAEVRAIV